MTQEELEHIDQLDATRCDDCEGSGITEGEEVIPETGGNTHGWTVACDTCDGVGYVGKDAQEYAEKMPLVRAYHSAMYKLQQKQVAETEALLASQG